MLTEKYGYEMDDFDLLRFAGCILVIIAYGVLLAHRRSALFGLNILNVFMVASATLFGFVFATVSGQSTPWVTAEHPEVVSYSICGLLAMAGGIYLGWTPTRDRASLGAEVDPFKSSNHINEDMGWLTFCAGAAAELALPFVASVRTVSTAVHCAATLGKIGLCILLVAAIRSGRWSRFVSAVVMFALLSVVGSLASGFSFVRLKTVFPLLVIWLALSGLTLPNILRLCFVIPAVAAGMFSAGAAWFETRQMIRDGLLAGLPLMEQANTFFAEYLKHLSVPTAESVMQSIMTRVDMTNILAAQVRYQPAVEPYARGDTLWSVLYTFVPRLLWADKPVTAGGSAFVARFTGLRWGGETSVGLPYPFELYANGGPVLVVVGLGVIGYVCGRMEMKMAGPQDNLGGFWALAIATATLTEGGERMDTVLPALVASALTVYALGMLVERFRGGAVGGASLAHRCKRLV
ncbi:MAG: hypothetical protein ABJA98_10210 [Acidobacteriota bacterium]